jgi:hypothetical protein
LPHVLTPLSPKKSQLAPWAQHCRSLVQPAVPCAKHPQCPVAVQNDLWQQSLSLVQDPLPASLQVGAQVRAAVHTSDPQQSPLTWHAPVAPWVLQQGPASGLVGQHCPVAPLQVGWPVGQHPPLHTTVLQVGAASPSPEAASPGPMASPASPASSVVVASGCAPSPPPDSVAPVSVPPPSAPTVASVPASAAPLVSDGSMPHATAATTSGQASAVNQARPSIPLSFTGTWERARCASRSQSWLVRCSALGARSEVQHAIRVRGSRV